MAQFIGVNIDEVPDQRGGAIPKWKPCIEIIMTLGSKLKDKICICENSDSQILILLLRQLIVSFRVHHQIKKKVQLHHQ